jgi:hypothetical protein
MTRELQRLRRMVCIEHADDEEVKVLLEPDDIALRTMEDLDDARVGEDDAHLVPHGLPDLGHEEINDKIATGRGRDLHQGKEASKGAVGVVFKVDSNDGACSEVGDELLELNKGRDMGEGGLSKGFGRSWRGSLCWSEKERRVREVGQLMVVRMRRYEGWGRARRACRRRAGGEGRGRRGFDV